MKLEPQGGAFDRIDFVKRESGELGQGEFPMTFISIRETYYFRAYMRKGVYVWCRLRELYMGGLVFWGVGGLVSLKRGERVPRRWSVLLSKVKPYGKANILEGKKVVG